MNAQRSLSATIMFCDGKSSGMRRGPFHRADPDSGDILPATIAMAENR